MAHPDVFRGVITGDESDRLSNQACLLPLLNKKDPKDKTWGEGEVAALVKMRTDGCSWEQIELALAHPVDELKNKHAEVCDKLKAAGFNPANYAYYWAARYNKINNFNVRCLTTGDCCMGEGPDPHAKPELSNTDPGATYDDFGGLLSVGEPKVSLIAQKRHLDKHSKLSGTGPRLAQGSVGTEPSFWNERAKYSNRAANGDFIDPILQARAMYFNQGANGITSGSSGPEAGPANQPLSFAGVNQALNLTQGANGIPSGSSGPAAGPADLARDFAKIELALVNGAKAHMDLEKAKTDLKNTELQLATALEANSRLVTALEHHNRLLDSVRAGPNPTNSNETADIEATQRVDSANCIDPTLGLLDYLKDNFLRDLRQNAATVNTGSAQFIDPTLGLPDSLKDNFLRNLQQNAGPVEVGAGMYATAPAPAHMVPPHFGGYPGPQQHPVEALYMARIAEKRWRESSWSGGGTLPLPFGAPAPNLSEEEMLELQDLVREYDTALHGQDVHGKDASGKKTKAEKTKEEKFAKYLRKGKVVTIAASDTTSSSDSEEESSSKPSTSAAASKKTPEANAQYYSQVLAAQFPPHRAFAADKAWSEEDCRILAVIEAKYDALRFKQYQSDFFNATGRMVPDYLIQAKMDRDGRPLADDDALSSSSWDSPSSRAPGAEAKDATN